MHHFLEKLFEQKEEIKDVVLRQMNGVVLLYDWMNDILVMKAYEHEDIVLEHVMQMLEERPMIHPLDKNLVRDCIDKIKRGEGFDSVDIRWQDPSVQKFETYRVSFRFLNEDMNPIAVGFAFDVTRECELEAAVKNVYAPLIEDENNLERTLLRHACQNEFYMMIVIDGKTGRAKERMNNEGDKGSRFIPIENIDENAEKYLKKYADERDLNIIIEQTKLEKIRRELKNEKWYQVYYRSKNINGQMKFFRAKYSYINKDEELICCTIADVTSSVMQNQEKEDAIKLSMERERKAEDAKDVFLSNMSHQIRTPLNAIVGMAEIAKADMNNPKKVAECMDIILASSQSLIHVVSDILDTSSTQAGGIKLVPSVQNINNLLDQIGKDFIFNYKKSGQSFKIHTDIKHSLVMMDGERAVRVTMNLLANAAKFSPENGQISLNVTEIPGEKASEGCLKVEVCDNGKGISEEDLEHVFEPFYRDKDSQTNYLSGTGLGLSVVKSIIETKGAEIFIESKPNQGTKVTIMNPVTFVEEGAQNKEKESLILKNRRVLLVEDQPINMMVAKRMLERLGAVVDGAEQGQLAVEKFLGQPEGTYDIIFMDIQMPVMDGYEATRQIRSSDHADASTIKIVSMTANVLPEDVEKAKSSGMNAHIGKPIRTEELQQLIINLLDLKLGGKTENERVYGEI